MESKFRGKVKFYVENKGFGFLTNTETGKDIFFHHTGLLDQVKAEDLVEYETEDGDRGIKAISIRFVKPEEEIVEKKTKKEKIIK